MPKKFHSQVQYHKTKNIRLIALLSDKDMSSTFSMFIHQLRKLTVTYSL